MPILFKNTTNDNNSFQNNADEVYLGAESPGNKALKTDQVPTINVIQVANNGGVALIKTVFDRPTGVDTNFISSATKGSPVLPIYDTFTINEASLIDGNRFNKWVFFFSCDTEPAVTSSPASYVTKTGTILTGYANLNRIELTLDYNVSGILKVFMNITQMAGANLDPAPPVAIDPNLIAFYQFEEPVETENILVDSSSYNNAAINGGITQSERIAGKVGNAINMTENLTPSIFIADHDASMDFSGNEITIIGWFQFPDATATKGIMAKDFSSGVGGFQMYRHTDGTFRFELGVNAVSSRVSSVYTTINGTWVHAAVTYNGTIARLYINGVENATKSYTGSINASTGNLNVLGTATIPFRTNSKADQLRLYNRVLTAGEILDIYNNEV